MISKKKRVFQDERTIQIEQKLGNEVAFLAIILLLISIFVKITFWNLSVEAYLPEIVIIVGMEIYSFIRSLQLGLEIRRYDLEKGVKGWRSRLVNGLITAIVVLVASSLGKFPKIQGYLNQYSFLKFLVILMTMSVVSTFLDKGVDWINNKCRKYLEKELED